MSNNKLISAKEVALKGLKREQKAIAELLSKVVSQANRLQIEVMDLKNGEIGENAERLTSSSVSINPTTPNPSMVDEVSSKTVQVVVESHVNDLDLDLSMTPALGFKNSLNNEENSEVEDSD